MIVVNLTAIAALAFLTIVTWLGLRYAEREYQFLDSNKDNDDPGPFAIHYSNIARAEQYEGEAEKHRQRSDRLFKEGKPNFSKKERIAGAVLLRAAEMLRAGEGIADVEEWVAQNIDKEHPENPKFRKKVIPDRNLAERYHQQAADLRVKAATRALEFPMASKKHIEDAVQAQEAELRILAGEPPEEVENWLRGNK